MLATALHLSLSLSTSFLRSSLPSSSSLPPERREDDGEVGDAGAIATILSNPAPDSSAAVPELVVQVVDLKPIGTSTTRFTFMANDGKMKLKVMLSTHFASEIHSENLQNLGLIRILDYSCNSIPNQTENGKQLCNNFTWVETLLYLQK